MKKNSPEVKHWGLAWLAMAAALALHVADEALTGFLPMYNDVVSGFREEWPLFPMPTFTFSGWLTALITGITVMFALTPLAFAGKWGLRYLAYPLSVIMILNGLGHMALSIYTRTFAPGVYSSPVVLACAIALLVTTIRFSRLQSPG